jgi:TIR domain
MTWRVFYSYSHQDTKLRDQLGTFLAPLRQNKKIADWHDRKIEPGSNWQSEISQRLEEANLVIFLVSPDFLNSGYCLGVEVESALGRLKDGAAKVLPVLVRECLWEESVFSQLQMIPRDAKPIVSQYWQSNDEAFKEVAKEIRNVVSSSPPVPKSSTEVQNSNPLKSSFDLVKQQVRSYARLYERTRLRMRPSDERTIRMEEIASHLRNLALASYPLLDEFVQSPFPGERLAAVATLQVFGAEKYLGFLTGLVGSEKPFISYQAMKALRFAVDSFEPASYPRLREALNEAGVRLQRASVGFDTDRQETLREAMERLDRNIAAIPVDLESFD